MAGETTTTLANYIDTTYAPDQAIKTFYDDAPFLRLLGVNPNTVSSGVNEPGDSMDWTVKSAGHTAVNYSEGDTPPLAGNATTANLTLSYKYAWDVAQITSHAMDALRNGRINPVESALNDAADAVIYKQEQNMVASFIAAINDDTNYAGQTRATYNLDSDVTAGGSAALTEAGLKEMYATLRIAPRAVPMNRTALISSFEQIEAYTEIVGVQYNEHMHNWDAESNLWDIGRIKPSVAYNNRPWFEIPTMTNTYVFMVQLDTLEVQVKKALNFVPLGKTDDSDKVLVTSAMELRCLDPYRNGRIEALTT